MVQLWNGCRRSRVRWDDPRSPVSGRSIDLRAVASDKLMHRWWHWSSQADGCLCKKPTFRKRYKSFHLFSTSHTYRLSISIFKSLQWLCWQLAISYKQKIPNWSKHIIFGSKGTNPSTKRRIMPTPSHWRYLQVGGFRSPSTIHCGTFVCRLRLRMYLHQFERQLVNFQTTTVWGNLLKVHLPKGLKREPAAKISPLVMKERDPKLSGSKCKLSFIVIT